MSVNHSSIDERKGAVTSTLASDEAGYVDGVLGDNEDFDKSKKTKGVVEFRTVGWPRVGIIFLKVQFALGVLSIPSAMYPLGAVGGALSVVGWDGAVIQGDFRNRHAGCHNIADMAYALGRVWMRELCGGLFVIAYVLRTGAGIVGAAAGLNALSHQGVDNGLQALLLAVGQTVERVAYGVGMVGLVVSAVIYLHVAAKYCFVRLLRNSEHLQANAMIHWATRFGCTFGLAVISFILAESIPIFNYLIALTGSVCFALLATILPSS